MSELLLHICCAPCGGGCTERLTERESITPVLYYSNSNLCSKEEFDRRLASVRHLAEARGLELEVDPYDHEAWLRAISGFEDSPEGGDRCSRCFAFNLKRTAMRAAEKKLDFSTTLTVSPRKSSKKIFAEGEKFSGFVPRDFKKQEGYKRSCEIAKELGFYRQNFCGCEFSKRDDSPKNKDKNEHEA